MNNDTVAIALDRIRFYAKDAVVTLTQASALHSALDESVMADSFETIVYL